jgi:PUA domain protein
MELIMPKKSSIYQTKCPDNVALLVVENEPLFFQHFDGPFIPTLRLLHKFPEMMKKVQVDMGAIKFILSGADIMCPGLTSTGEGIDPVLEKGAVVVSTIRCIK